jgi:hypothetical protein
MLFLSFFNPFPAVDISLTTIPLNRKIFSLVAVMGNPRSQVLYYTSIFHEVR